MARRRSVDDSKLRRKLRQFPKDLTANIRPAIEGGAKELRDHMAETAPKDKGRLGEAAHYVVSRDGLSAKVGYSDGPGFKRKWRAGGFEVQFQEFGTVHHAAQPFVRPAYRAKLPNILKRIEDAVRLTLRKASDGYF